MIDKIQIMTGDYAETISSMSNESVGKLFKAIFTFAEGGEVEDIKNDELVAPTFFNLKKHIERLEEARQDKVNAGRSGGLKGGAPAGNCNASKTKQNKAKQSKTNQNKAEQSKTNQNKPPIPIPIPLPIPKPINNKELCQEVIEYLNEKTGKKFRVTDQNCKLINARLNDGYTLQNFMTVINKKCKKWLNDEKMRPYLQPSTLFAPSHFDNYLNEPEEKTSDDILNEWAKGEQDDKTGVFANYTEIESSIPKLPD